MLPALESSALGYLAILVSLVVAILALSQIRVPVDVILDRLRDRFIWGIPWGTVVCLGGLLIVYAFVQRGFWHWNSPVIVAFTSVSMFDPVGWVFAGFSHASPGHLRNNLTTTIVFAPIVEYIWGHYPQERPNKRLPNWLQRPLVRAIVLFPGGIFLLGIIASLFSWGPVIGFSVAAFALIGIVLVHYPVIAIIALIVRAGVRIIWRTANDPVIITETAVRAVRPSWYGTAVQGHLVGLLLGVLIGIALLRYRRERPNPLHLFAGGVLIGLYLSVWGVWWILGPERFVLFQGLGVALVVLVATAITLAAYYDVDSPSVSLSSLSRYALVILLVAVLGMGIVGIGLNLAVVEPPDSDPAIGVSDYDIYYAEGVPDGMVNIVELEGFGLTTDVRTSGVIVVSEDRNVWRNVISATEMETRGIRRFHVGGIGWSEQITVVRNGWIPVGNSSVYQIWIGDADGFTPAYTSEAREARPVLADHHFSIIAEDGTFQIRVEYQESVEVVSLPTDESVIEVFEIELLLENDSIIAHSNGTDVPIAHRETYR